MPSRGFEAAAQAVTSDHGVAGAHDDRAVRLLGEAAGFDRQRLLADGDVAGMHCSVFPVKPVADQELEARS